MPRALLTKLHTMPLDHHQVPASAPPDERTPYQRAVADRHAAARQQRAEGGSLADYGLREQQEWLGGQSVSADAQFLVYRAMRERGPILPGDYVTNSSAYARKHLESNLGGEGFIVEQRVHLDEIFPADGPREFWFLPRTLDQVLASTVTGPASSAQLEQWFRGSAIADPSGSPLRVYHGTRSEIEMLHPGERATIHFSDDPALASHFATDRVPDYEMDVDDGSPDADEGSPNVIAAYLRVVNPFDPENEAHREALGGVINLRGDWETLEHYASKIKALGFDGILVDGTRDVAVFNSSQVQFALSSNPAPAVARASDAREYLQHVEHPASYRP